MTKMNPASNKFVQKEVGDDVMLSSDLMEYITYKRMNSHLALVL